MNRFKFFLITSTKFSNWATFSELNNFLNCQIMTVSSHLKIKIEWLLEVFESGIFLFSLKLRFLEIDYPKLVISLLTILNPIKNSLEFRYCSGIRSPRSDWNYSYLASDRSSGLEIMKALADFTGWRNGINFDSVRPLMK